MTPPSWDDACHTCGQVICGCRPPTFRDLFLGPGRAFELRRELHRHCGGRVAMWSPSFPLWGCARCGEYPVSIRDTTMVYDHAQPASCKETTR